MSRLHFHVAAVLVGILLVQSAGQAQGQREPAIRPIAREQAIKIMLTRLQPGTDVGVRLVGDMEVEGQLVETCDDEVVVLVSGQRRAIQIADIVSVKRPRRQATSNGGRSFARGTAIGTGLFGIAILVAAVAMR